MCMHSTCRKMNFHPHRIPLAPYTNYYQCLIKANVFNSVTILTRTDTHTQAPPLTHSFAFAHTSLTYSNLVLVSLSIGLLLYVSCKLNLLILPFSIPLRPSNVSRLEVRIRIFWCAQHKEVNKYLMSTGKCEWLQCSLTPSMQMYHLYDSTGKKEISLLSS